MQLEADSTGYCQSVFLVKTIKNVTEDLTEKLLECLVFLVEALKYFRLEPWRHCERWNW